MVLDEDALEAMLKRQRQQAEASESKESTQTELKERTEEFEVYERPGADLATGTGIRSRPSPENTWREPEAAEPTTDPPGGSDTTPEPEPPVETEPEPVPEAVPEPESEPEPEDEAKEEAPEVSSAPEPESIEEDRPPERPRVWPPLSGSRNGATKQAETTTHEPVQEPEPEPMAEPEVDSPAPEPAPEPEPVPDPTPAETSTGEEAAAADPHAHAHADLDVDGGGVRIAIVQALFNQEITDMMGDLATARAKKRGAKVTHHLTVPGVYDLPLTVARLLEREDVDCAVVIGVVVEGETSHDELITSATARTLQQLSLDVDKPIGFGVTGPGMTWKQAEARVANGAHAVDAALAQVELLKSL